jgi:hypothetical protein
MLLTFSDLIGGELASLGVEIQRACAPHRYSVAVADNDDIVVVVVIIHLKSIGSS